MIEGRRSLTRREVLRGGLALGAAVALPGSLAACGSSSSSSSSGAASRSGGSLRAAALGATNETLNASAATALADFARVQNIFDQLVLAIDGKLQLSLAKSLTPNADGTVWTIVLVDATFHDGRPVTADDVAATFRFFANPKGFFGPSFINFDLANLKSIDKRTLRVPFKQSVGDLMSVLNEVSYVMPAGMTNFSKPIGSGPFQVVNYAPGNTCVMKAYKKYWGGPPPLDTLEIRSIDSADARLRALKSGQIDYASGITPTAARIEASNPQVQIINGGAANSYALGWIMNTTKPPFNDVRVRRAMALATDRQALINVAFEGYGVVGNDVVGQGLSGFTTLPQRPYDPAQAKRLLAQAGQSNLKFTMRAVDAPPGTLAAAQLWVQQLAKIGVTATLNVVPVSDQYNNAEQNAALIQSGAFINNPTLFEVENFTAATTAVGIGGGFKPPAFDALLAKAQRTVDPAARQQLIDQISRQLDDEGPYVVWGYASELDCARAGVKGVRLSVSLPLFGRASL